MLELAWPWLLLALPLPWVLRLLLPRARQQASQALRVPFYDELTRLAGGDALRQRRVRHLLPLLAWVLLCIAAARPQWLGEARDLPLSGRDLMLAVDVSGSMAAEDMQIGGRYVDRLSAVKVVLGDFLERRVGGACATSSKPARSDWRGARPPSAMRSDSR
jgi:Ca-activated chloride channel family protein